MAKVLIEKYPIGSIPGQRTDGRYMDDALRSNIDIFAKNIIRDMQFLGLVCSSTYEVRSGKSTFLQQIGEYYTDAVNRIHNLNLTFTMKNIVFNSAQLEKRAFELPRYSFLLLDENDEMDEHYFSKLAKDLRRFFKKSGQLNLFIMIVAPNFFQLKPGYAISRSNFLLDVKFAGEFDRGYFSFYSFPKKRELYIKGKKTYDYTCVAPDFSGRFLSGYAVPEKEYKDAKLKDLMEKEEGRTDSIDRDIIKRLFLQFVKNNPTVGIEQACIGFGIGRTTGFTWIRTEKKGVEGESVGTDANAIY